MPTLSEQVSTAAGVLEAASDKAKAIVETDSVITTEAGVRDSLPMVLRKAKEALKDLGTFLVGSFEVGSVTVTNPTQVVRLTETGDDYRWDGDYPKTVTAGTVAENGGEGVGLWVNIGVVTLRSDLKYNVGNLVQSKPVFSSDYSTPVSLLNAVPNYSQIFALFCDKSKRKAVLQTIERGTPAASDSSNVGGSACARFTEAFVIKDAIYAQLNPFASSLVTTSNTITQANWNTAIGAPISFGGRGDYRNSTWGIPSYKTYSVQQNGTIEFFATDDSSVLFYKSATSSESVNIYTDKAVSGTYALVETISLAGDGGYKHHISANTKVKIENTTTSTCYVIGVDVDSIFNAKTTRHYDSLTYYRDDNYNGSTAYWIGPGEGANEIAMRPVGGKFFCSYHGGHSDETVSAFVDGVAFDTATALTFSYGDSASVISNSTVSSESASYDMTLTMTVASGTEYSNVKIIPQLGESERMRELFTCMTIAPSRFGRVLAPTALEVNGVVGTELELTSSNDITQFDKVKRQTIRTTFTDFSTVGSSKRTSYIQTRAQDNKLYYNVSEDGASFFERLDLDIVRTFSTI